MELFKYQRDAQASECFVCLETGHRGKQCPFLVAVLVDTVVGRTCLRDARTRVPPEVADSVNEHRINLRFVMQFNYPLRQSCIMARKLMYRELSEGMILESGSYDDRQALMHEPIAAVDALLGDYGLQQGGQHVSQRRDTLAVHIGETQA